MIEVRGRSPLEKYSGWLPVVNDTDVNGIFDMLGIPADLRSVILAIKDGRIVQHSEIIQDGSAVDLIVMPEGG